MNHLPYDIGRCVNNQCGRRLSCARFTSSYHTDVLYSMNRFEEDNCEHFIDNTDYEKAKEFNVNNVMVMARDQLLDAYVTHLTPEVRSELVVELACRLEGSELVDTLYNLLWDADDECYQTDWLRGTVRCMDNEALREGGARK